MGSNVTARIPPHLSGPPPGADESTVARFTADRGIAERAFAVLGEILDPELTACALFETPSGDWTVAVHCRDAPDQAALREIVEAAVGAQHAGRLAFETIKARDWVQASLAGLTPVSAGRFIIHGAHDRGYVPVNRIGIEIEAALAFGTGHHGSTRGCLLAFDDILKKRRPRRVLDVGTGTGVLAIAAARALHQCILASDIDPQAVAVARANTGLNHAAGLVQIVRATGLIHARFGAPGRYDLIFANILLGPLQRLARPIGGLLGRRGHVVLAGLLPAHANAAYAAYQTQGLVLERRLLVDGWVTLVLRRRRRPG